MKGVVSKQILAHAEAAIGCIDRLGALVSSWTPTGDGFLIADHRDAWGRTAQDALTAVDLVLADLKPGRLHDAAATCRCRVEEVDATDHLISADIIERLHSARTALGIACEVLRPSWALIPLKHVAEVSGYTRFDNVLRACRNRNVRTARCRGVHYADPHGLVAAGLMTLEQIADFSLRFPSERPQISSSHREVAAKR